MEALTRAFVNCTLNAQPENKTFFIADLYILYDRHFILEKEDVCVHTSELQWSIKDYNSEQILLNVCLPVTKVRLFSDYVIARTLYGDDEFALHCDDAKELFATLSYHS